MDLDIKYRGRIATTKDVAFINKLITENPDDSRRALSIKLCEAWGWKQPNGALRDMVCRGFMLELHRAGYIKLPPRKFTPNNPFVKRKKPVEIHIDLTPVAGVLKTVLPLKFRQVRQGPLEKVYNSLMDQYHYLGYGRSVGEHLKYIIYSDARPVACMAWSSAPRHIGARDRFVGWDSDTRRRNIHLMAYNTRFLILPWIRIPHLASHILGRMSRILSKEWEEMYSHPVYYLETFVDKERFKGTCYKAANWINLGDTTGRGKNDQTHKQNRSIKAVLGYPLTRDFRKHLMK